MGLQPWPGTCRPVLFRKGYIRYQSLPKIPPPLSHARAVGAGQSHVQSGVTARAACVSTPVLPGSSPLSTFYNFVQGARGLEHHPGGPSPILSGQDQHPGLHSERAVAMVTC